MEGCVGVVEKKLKIQNKVFAKIQPTCYGNKKNVFDILLTTNLSLKSIRSSRGAWKDLWKDQCQTYKYQFIFQRFLNTFNLAFGYGNQQIVGEAINEAITNGTVKVWNKCNQIV